MQAGASSAFAETALSQAKELTAGWPAWPWPFWVQGSAPAFVYFDETAYPSSMDRCMAAQLPVCSQKQGLAFAHCTDVVFQRCKNESLPVAAVYQPYPSSSF